MCEPNKGCANGKEVGCTKSPVKCELIIKMPALRKLSKMLENVVY